MKRAFLESFSIESDIINLISNIIYPSSSLAYQNGTTHKVVFTDDAVLFWWLVPR